MKTKYHPPFISVAMLFAPLLLLVPLHQARADLDIYGSWRYSFSGKTYFRTGPLQSGRYSRLAGGWYAYGFFTRGYYATNYLENTSSEYTSGSISLEMWQTPRYNGSSGYVKMTRRLASLDPDEYYYDITRYGYSRRTFRYGYHTLKVWTPGFYGGWQTDDSLGFPTYAYDG